MKLFITLCAFINSWFGTSFGEPTARFRKREFYKRLHYPPHFIGMLNQHLLLHSHMSSLVPDNSVIKYEHDEAVTSILKEHALSRAAKYNKDVFQYTQHILGKSSDKLEFVKDPTYFEYPLYEMTTTADLTQYLMHSGYRQHPIDDNTSLVKDDDVYKYIAPPATHVGEFTLTQLSRLDVMLIDTVLNKYIKALDDTSITNFNNTEFTLRMVRDIQTIIEMVCFMSGVHLTRETADRLIDKLKLCQRCRYGINPNEDNPVQRCLDMLEGGNFNRGVILTTYLCRTSLDYIIKSRFRTRFENGSFVYNVFNANQLLGQARNMMIVGEQHQWFQTFEFKRKPVRHVADLPNDMVVYRDEILSFSKLLYEDKSLESWKGAIVTDLNGIPTGETV